LKACLRSGLAAFFVSADGERWLLLWPEGYTAKNTDGRIEVVDEAGTVSDARETRSG
jgi:hypothetical protein